MSVRLLLRCDCVVDFHENAQIICPRHGPQGVARALNVPPPRIRGVASGPHVTTMDLAPSMARIAGTEKTAEGKR